MDGRPSQFVFVVGGCLLAVGCASPRNDGKRASEVHIKETKGDARKEDADEHGHQCGEKRLPADFDELRQQALGREILSEFRR